MMALILRRGTRALPTLPSPELMSGKLESSLQRIRVYKVSPQFAENFGSSPSRGCDRPGRGDQQPAHAALHSPDAGGPRGDGRSLSVGRRKLGSNGGCLRPVRVRTSGSLMSSGLPAVGRLRKVLPSQLAQVGSKVAGRSQGVRVVGTEDSAAAVEGILIQVTGCSNFARGP
jgi:hypothetical protein